MKKALATNLRKVRVHLGWKSARVAAKFLNVPAQRYRAWEEGRGEPSAEMLCQIAEVMGITNLRSFLGDPHFDYKNQDALPGFKSNSPLQTNYRLATDRDRKVVDLILGLGQL